MAQRQFISPAMSLQDDIVGDDHGAGVAIEHADRAAERRPLGSGLRAHCAHVILRAALDRQDAGVLAIELDRRQELDLPQCLDPLGIPLRVLLPVRFRRTIVPRRFDHI